MPFTPVPFSFAKTGDFGEIVFNLIGIEQMRKTEQDRREDFDDVFDFDTELRQRFQITVPQQDFDPT